ncbi:hypothetical protein LCGC14_2146790 [marine sediment metagenome]|uniref:Phage portal protein n=1 Tax=marine sediment metagenome TaxID=412755 RepID=A0A0F9EJ05_9ZZZZ
MSLYSLFAGSAVPGIRAEELSLTSTRGWEPSLYYAASSTGEIVTPQTATALSAYYACIVLLAATEALLPLKVLKKRPGGGSDEVPEHPVYDLLQMAPNDDTTAVNFRQDWMSFYLGWGHGYSKVGRDGNGDASSLQVVDTSIIQTRRDASGLYYEIRVPGKGLEILRSADMLDLRGVRGWSVARSAIDSLGIGLSEQKYAGSYLGQASSPAGVLETDGVIQEPAMNALRSQWQKRQGGAGKVGLTPVLAHGLHYKQISINPSDAQLLESRKYSVEEVCRWFGVPPEMIGRREQAQGWQAREHLAIEFVQHSLMPHLIQIEQETGKKLLTAAERAQGFYIRHSGQALLRADSKTRATFYGLLLRLGALSPNEIRSFEDMNPVGPAGDTYFMTTNLAPLEKVASGEAAEEREAAGAGFGASSTSTTGPSVETGVRGIFDDPARRIAHRRVSSARRLMKKYGEDAEALEIALVDLDKADCTHTSSAFAPAMGLVAGRPVEADELMPLTSGILASQHASLSLPVALEEAYLLKIYFCFMISAYKAVYNISYRYLTYFKYYYKG